MAALPGWRSVVIDDCSRGQLKWGLAGIPAGGPYMQAVGLWRAFGFARGVLCGL